MPRILIADDNSNIQKMVTLALHGAGIDVVSVSNGGAAIRSLPESLPDLVLADVFMPVRNGYEVCDFIKHDTRFSHVPVVLLVGAFDPLDETEAQRVSADGILKKPFIPPDPLISLVKALLSKAFHERPEPVPVRVAEHAGQEAAPDEADHAAAAPAAAAAISESAADEFMPGLIEADFGSHEETLAFGSLLEMPTLAETSVAPPVEEKSPDSLRAGEEHDFLGAEIPELDDVVPPDSMNKTLHAAVADHSNGAFAGNGSEAAADVDAELGFQITPDLGEELEAALEPEGTEEFEVHTEFHPDVSSAASFDPVGDTETDALAEQAATEPKPWENAGPPAHVELAVMADSAGGVIEETLASEDLAEGSEPGYAELAESELIGSEPAELQPPIPEGIHEASQLSSSDGASSSEPSSDASSSGDLPSWPPPGWGSPALVVPVFPGSDKLWAAAPPAPSEATQAPAEDEKKEIAGQANAESAHETGTVLSFVGDYGLAEIVLPALDDASLTEDPLNESGITEHVADLPPAERLAEMAAASATSDAELEQHYAAQPAPRPAPDPELIEAVVTRIVERMQPKVIEVVTREILRPLVEALVRREINRNN